MSIQDRAAGQDLSKRLTRALSRAVERQPTAKPPKRKRVPDAGDRHQTRPDNVVELHPRANSTETNGNNHEIWPLARSGPDDPGAHQLSATCIPSPCAAATRF